MNYININEDNIDLLVDFLYRNTNGQKSFRYFKNRKITAIKNHFVTRLFYLKNKCIGYGHLDKESDFVWLGIMVSDEERGNGYGGIIMENLIESSCNYSVYLTVDKENKIAYNLYKKCGFLLESENEKYYKMVLKK